MIGSDGPKNIVDSVDYVCSRVWDDGAGRDRVGVVLVQDQQIFAARDVMKGDARPGGYVATGGHGGIPGTAGGGGGVVLRYLPLTKHTHLSDVNISHLPDAVDGIARFTRRPCRPSKTPMGAPRASQAIIKDTGYCEDNYDGDPSEEVDIGGALDSS